MDSWRCAWQSCVAHWFAYIHDVVAPAVWSITTDLLVPIAAAGIAAWVVVRQIRQLDRHRTEDRTAQALLALNEVLYREVELGSLDDRAEASIERFKNGSALFRAFALLPPENHVIGRWVAAQRQLIEDENLRAFAVREAMPPRDGAHRKEASRIAVSAVNHLLDWQQGRLKREWFEQNL